MAYLLAWNRNNWPWDSLRADVAAIRRGSTPAGGRSSTRWNCGNGKVRKGDRLFLLKQGEPPRGLMASGWAASDAYEAEHWDANRAGQGDRATFIDVEFDALLDPDEEPLLDAAAFDEGPLAEVYWTTRMSGIRIAPPEAVPALEAAWTEHLGELGVEKRPAPAFANTSPPDAPTRPLGIPHGITRDDVLQALNELDSGRWHSFGASAKFDLLHEGRRYPPKAALGIAARRVLGRPLKAGEFSSGEGCFSVLRSLGFQVVPKATGAAPPPKGKEGKKWWAMGCGEGGRLWNEFQEKGIVAFGMDYLGDLKQYADQDAITDAIRAKIGPEAPNPMNDSLACYEFARDMKEGDYVVAKIGQRRVLGVGVVDSDYKYDDSRSEYFHTRKVRWLKAKNLDLPKGALAPLKMLTDVTERDALVDFVREHLLEDDGTITPPPVAEPFTVDEAMANLFMPRRQFEAMLDALRRKKNLVLQGPPGVGKTFVARQLAYALMGFRDKARVEMVQFHQSYAYEDFVQGWRPNPSGGFQLRNGVFYEFCDRARIDVGRPYVFVIDEINRGNLSRIFGELMMLIEPDKRGPDHAIPLTYSDPGGERFSVPENLHVLGLMNTADRSLAMVDYALRRRFAFVDLDPQFDGDAFRAHLRARGAGDALVDRVVARMAALNKRIVADHKNLGRGFAVGHSYFCPANGEACDEAWFRKVVQTEVAPLLREYWFDAPQKAQGLVDELLA